MLYNEISVCNAPILKSEIKNHFISYGFDFQLFVCILKVFTATSQKTEHFKLALV